MQIQPGGVTYSSSPTTEPVRQGEISSLIVALDASVSGNSSLVARLYKLAERLGVPTAQDAFEPATPPEPIGQLGQARDVVGRLERENLSFVRIVEALETL